MPIQITYSGQIVSNNQMKSLHWRKLKKIIDPIKTNMWVLVKKAKLPKMEKISIWAKYNSRHDCDNVSATIKLMADQLVKCGRIPDDNKNHWPEVTITWDKELPHNTVVFEIREIN